MTRTLSRDDNLKIIFSDTYLKCEYKKPTICVQDRNVVTKVATFNDVRSMELFADALVKILNVDVIDER